MQYLYSIIYISYQCSQPLIKKHSAKTWGQCYLAQEGAFGLNSLTQTLKDISPRSVIELQGVENNKKSCPRNKSECTDK